MRFADWRGAVRASPRSFEKTRVLGVMFVLFHTIGKRNRFDRAFALPLFARRAFRGLGIRWLMSARPQRRPSGFRMPHAMRAGAPGDISKEAAPNGKSFRIDPD